MEPFLKRSDVQDKLKELVQASQNKDLVKDGVRVWLDSQNVSQFEAQQILNDLTSYQEYLSLLN